MNQVPSLGRIVLYQLNEMDAEAINRRRTTRASIVARMAVEVMTVPPIAAWPAGAQAHMGNTVAEGDVFPMMITAVRITNEMEASVNGQVFLDGNDVLWVQTRALGDQPGTYRWPPRT
jgi:hypothetical protein